MAEPEPKLEDLTMRDLMSAHRILSDVFKNNPEPMPDWSQGDRHLLETCRGCTETSAFGVRKYPDLASAAAKLFYSTIKLHPFPNGNKRFGFALLLMFLIRNKSHLTCPPGTIASLAKEMSQSDPHHPNERPDLLVSSLTLLLKKYIAPGTDHFWEAEPPKGPHIE
jgi:death-on-curing family protein